MSAAPPPEDVAQLEAGSVGCSEGLASGDALGVSSELRDLGRAIFDMAGTYRER